MAKASSIVSRLTYRFRDGCLDDETSTFTQLGTFRLLRDHHIQKGPSSANPVDVEVDTATGMVTSRSADKDGEEKVETEHMELPPDLSNGLIAVSLLNVKPNVAPFKISMLAASGMGMVVKLAIEPVDEQSFRAVVGVPGLNVPVDERELDKESLWDGARSTSQSRW